MIRLLLADLQTAYRQDKVVDGASCYRFADLAEDAHAWAKDAQLVLAGNQCLVLYSGSLELLGVVEFFGRQDAIAAEVMVDGATSLYGHMCIVLEKCPLGCGLVVVEPLLRDGAADYLGTWQPHKTPGEWHSRPDPWVPYSFGMSLTGVHEAVNRPGRLGAWRLLAVPHCGPVTMYITRGRVQLRNLRCLDVTGSVYVTDANIAELLAACPSLTTLRATVSRLGPLTLAALSGCIGCGLGEGNESGNALPPTPQHVKNAAASQPPSLLPRSEQQQPSIRTRNHAQLTQQPTDGSPAPCAGGLQTLDISSCFLGESCGSALGGALCQLSSLRDLRISNVEGAEQVFAALQPQQVPAGERAEGGSASGTGTQHSLTALRGVVGQLTRLDMLGPDVDGLIPGSTSPVQAGNPASRGFQAHPVGSPTSRRGASTAGTAGAPAGAAGTAGSPSAGGLSWRHLELLTQHCTSLRHLAISSRRLAAEQQAAGPLGQYSADLLGPAQCEQQPPTDAVSQHGQQGVALIQAAQQGAAQQAAEQGRQQARPRLPSLLHLEVGWGTGGAFLWHSMLSSPSLASLVVHAGAVVNDWHLQKLAASCRHLGKLELIGSNVSDEGASAILASCRQLTSLQLQSCTGPITDALVLFPPLAPRAPAFRLQHLAISWSNLQLTDQGLRGLLDPSIAALRCLVLRGCSKLSDTGLWPALKQHAATLECLELGDCGSLQAKRKQAAQLVSAGRGDGGSRRGGGLGGKHREGSRVKEAAAAASTQVQDGSDVFLMLPGCEGPAPLSAEVAARALALCHRLQAVTIRGSVAWSGEIHQQIYEQPVVTAVLMP
ncbi:hypothetical protein N2152v2_006941 [Parachlorella kessleri]